MLNVISIQAFRKKSTWPSKVAKNLIKGLKLINESYIINWDPNVYKNIIVIDDEKYLSYLKNIRDLEILIWPIISKKWSEIWDIDYRFIYPSNWVKNIWDKYHRHKNSIRRPVWIDTYAYKNKLNKKDRVLIYTKRRTDDELNYVCWILNKLNIKYVHIDYTKWYKENNFIKQLNHTKYAIWIWWSESHWIALEEILSMNIPILVWDVKKVINGEKKELFSKYYSDEELNEFATSAEYFDDTCWIKFYDKEDVEMNIKHMEEFYNQYKPREYILKNLSLEKQARELLSYYKDSKRWNNIKKPKFILKNILIKIWFVFIDSKIWNYISPLIFKIYTFYLKIFGK